MDTNGYVDGLAVVTPGLVAVLPQFDDSLRVRDVLIPIMADFFEADIQSVHPAVATASSKVL